MIVMGGSRQERFSALQLSPLCKAALKLLSIQTLTFRTGSSGSRSVGVETDTFKSPTNDTLIGVPVDEADLVDSVSSASSLLTISFSTTPGLDDFEELGGVGDKLRKALSSEIVRL